MHRQLAQQRRRDVRQRLAGREVIGVLAVARFPPRLRRGFLRLRAQSLLPPRDRDPRVLGTQAVLLHLHRRQRDRHGASLPHLPHLHAAAVVPLSDVRLVGEAGSSHTAACADSITTVPGSATASASATISTLSDSWSGCVSFVS